jgi:hypothetical protein
MAYIPTTALPIIQASLDGTFTSPQTLSITAPLTVLYALSINMKSAGMAAAGHTYIKTVTYTSADGTGVQTINLVLHLDESEVVMETYPLFALGGTPISSVGTYGGGAVNDAFSLSERIVQMP